MNTQKTNHHTKKLTVAFLDFDDIKNPLLGAGQAKATVEVGKRLSLKGHTVNVYSARYPGSKDRTENGITYRHIGIGTSNIRLNNFLYILMIPFVVARIKADVIVECFTAPVSTLCSPLFTKTPVIALSTSFEAERFSKLYHFPFWIVEKLGARLYRNLIALNPDQVKKMRSLNPVCAIRLIGQGVGKEYLQVRSKKPEHILFLGRLDINQKGIDLLLRAYVKALPKIEYPLIIAGEGPSKSEIKSLVKTLGLQKRVKLVGFANEPKKLELLSRAVCVAFPSRSEGFSLFALEAIASGRRLVAFDLPSLYFSSKDVATTIEPFSIEKYASALVKEAKASFQKKFEKKCKAFARTYSWDAVAQQFESFFIETLQKRGIV